MDNLSNLMQNIQSRLTVNTDTSTNFNCPECQDEKFIPDNEGRYKQCDCLLREISRAKVDKLFKSAQIPKRFQGKTFSNYNSKRQPEAYKTCLEYLKNWQENQQEGKSLFLLGPVGTGKSHLAFAILNNLIQQGVPGMAATVPDLMDDLRPSENKSEEQIDMLKTLDFLVLDDLGAQKSSDWVTERLFVIINARYSNMLPTVVTSNHTLQELEKIPGWQRIIDRLMEMSEFIWMPGESYRKGE